MDEWAISVDLFPDALRTMIFMRALVDRMESSCLGRTRMGEITSNYLNQLRLSGRYPQLKSAAALQHAAAKGVTLDPRPSPSRVVTSLAAITSWAFPDNLDDYLEEMEFASVAEFIYLAEETVRAHLALFGVGLVDHDEEGTVLVVEDQEPMMTRGR